MSGAPQLFADADVVRGNDSISQPGESLFSFIASRDIPDAMHCREQLNSLFERYPDSDQGRIKHELQSGDTKQELGALHQLLTFYFLQSTGLKVTPEYQLESGSMPDFLLESPNGRSAIVECVVDHGDSKRDQQSNRIQDAFCLAREYVRTPGFSLRILKANFTNNQVSPKKLASAIDACFKSADPERSLPDSFELNEQHTFSDKHGNTVTFLALPTQSRDVPKQLIGCSPGSFGYADLSRPKNIIRDKTNQHKTGLPIVVSYACNNDSLSGDTDYFTTLRTLFGPEQTTFQYDRDTGNILSEHTTHSLGDDGLWVPFRNRTHQTPELVLWCERIRPPLSTETTARLWVNPHSEVDWLTSKWRGDVSYFTPDRQLQHDSGIPAYNMLFEHCS